MCVQPVTIGSSSVEERHYAVPEQVVQAQRMALFEVLRVTREDAVRLDEMVRLLGSAQYMSEERLGVLANERKVARERAMALEAELLNLDSTACGNCAAAFWK
jgi:hypothetical protein